MALMSDTAVVEELPPIPKPGTPMPYPYSVQGRSHASVWLQALVVIGCVVFTLALVSWSLFLYNESLGRGTIIYISDLGDLSTLSVTPGNDEDQIYIFICGCVLNPTDCGKANSTTWGEYFEQLQLARTASTGDARESSFRAWEKDHVFYLSATSSADGADALNAVLNTLASTNIVHLVGTSVGGSAIMSYFSRAMRGEVSIPVRISDAVLVDAPIGGDTVIEAMQSGLLKSDVEGGVGKWLLNKGIFVATIDTPNDLISNAQLPDVPTDESPIYGTDQPPTPLDSIDLTCMGWPSCLLVQIGAIVEARDLWHNYTGNHSALSADRIFQKLWR